MNRLALLVLGLMVVNPLAQAKLPPLSEEAAAKAAEVKAKATWSTKVDAYKLCLSQDKVATRYRQEKSAAAQPADAMPACADPGPYVAAAAVAAPAGSAIAGSAIAAPAGSAIAADTAAAPKK